MPHHIRRHRSTAQVALGVVAGLLLSAFAGAALHAALAAHDYCVEHGEPTERGQRAPAGQGHDHCPLAFLGGHRPALAAATGRFELDVPATPDARQPPAGAEQARQPARPLDVAPKHSPPA